MDKEELDAEMKDLDSPGYQMAHESVGGAPWTQQVNNDSIWEKVFLRVLV